MEQPERPPRVDERERGTAGRAGATRTARSACGRTPPRSRAPSSRPPGRPVHCSSTAPLRSSTCTCTTSLAVAEEAHLPAAGAASCRRSGRAAAARALGRTFSARAAIRSTSLRAALEEARRLGLRARASRAPPPRAAAGGSSQDERSAAQQRAPALSRARARCAKLHILFPMKLSGVARDDRDRLGGQLGHAGHAHEQLEHGRRRTGRPRCSPRRSARPGSRRGPPRARKVQWRFHQKLFSHRDHEGGVAATRWCSAERRRRRARRRTGSPRSRSRRPRRT